MNKNLRSALQGILLCILIILPTMFGAWVVGQPKEVGGLGKVYEWERSFSSVQAANEFTEKLMSLSPRSLEIIDLRDQIPKDLANKVKVYRFTVIIDGTLGSLVLEDDALLVTEGIGKGIGMGLLLFVILVIFIFGAGQKLWEDWHEAK